LELMRGMFSYAPRETAKLLADVAPVLYADEVELALPDDPDAWLAWARELRSRGRVAEASTRLDQTVRQWPDHLPSLRLVAEVALRQGDWDRLGELFPAGQQLPDDPQAAPVLACRARYHAGRGDDGAASADLERALLLDGASVTVRALAGDAFESLGDAGEARRQWKRALFLLPPAERALRESILVRLARLEDRQGAASRALQLWAEVLEVDPDHPEARRRLKELTDF
jgi:tetratricopeptide (TPR) repeat protein